MESQEITSGIETERRKREFLEKVRKDRWNRLSLDCDMKVS